MSYSLPITPSTLPLLLRTRQHHPRRREKDDERRETSLLLTNVTEGRWEQQRDTIKRLYREFSLRVVTDIMWSVYQFNQKDSTAYYRKVIKGVPKVKQERSKVVPKYDPGEPIMPDLEFDLRLPLPYPLNPANHRHQEGLLYNIDRCVYRLFDPGSHGWSATTAQLVSKNIASAGNKGINPWQHVSDQCYSASILAKAGMDREVEATLQRIIQEFTVPSVFNNTNIIDKLWRILFQLRGLEKHCPQLNPFQRVLGAIKAYSWAPGYFAGQRQDTEIMRYIHQLALCLSKTPPTEMDATLRVGMFKTLKEMRILTGENNATILSMWSYYCKIWEPRSFNQDEYKTKLRVLKAALDSDLAREQQGLPCEFSPESQVAIAYHYAYGVYYVCQEPDALVHIRQVKDLAVTLPCLTSAKPWWTLGTQAFAFSTRVLADQCRRHARIVKLTNDSDAWARYCARAMALIQIAVGKLENGDVECRIRAAMLATSLARWLREWKDEENAEEYQRRAEQIYKDLKRSNYELYVGYNREVFVK